MNYKRLGLILIIFMLLISHMSIISASDNAVDDAFNSIQEMLNINSNEDDGKTIHINGYAELVNWVKNYSKSNDSSSYVLSLEDGNYNATESIHFSDLKNLSKHITIEGNGHILDGKNKHQLLKLDGSSITLKNLVMQNAIYDSTNSAGAIMMLSPSELYVKNCSFKNNHGDKKGSVVTNRGNTSITESVFINNTVNEVGGAIWSTGEYGGNLNLTNNTFQENNAHMNGNNERTGIVYMVAGGVNVIDNNIFIKNTGRCIHCFNYTKTNITNNHFINNSLKFDDVIRGGVIDNYEADITICGNLFDDDLTEGELRGGILYHEIGQLEFYNNTVNNIHINNKVTSTGDCSKGGVLFNRNASAHIYNNTFNTVMKANLSRGGVIYNNLGNITLTGNVFNNTLVGNSIQGLSIHNDVNGIITAESNEFNSAVNGSCLGNDKERYVYNSVQKNSEGNGVRGVTNYK